MLLANWKNYYDTGQERWVIFGPNFWLVLETKAAVIRFKAQLGIPEDVHSFECKSKEPWEKFEAAAKRGNIDLEELVAE